MAADRPNLRIRAVIGAALFVVIWRYGCSRPGVPSQDKEHRDTNRGAVSARDATSYACAAYTMAPALRMALESGRSELLWLADLESSDASIANRASEVLAQIGMQSLPAVAVLAERENWSLGPMPPALRVLTEAACSSTPEFLALLRARSGVAALALGISGTKDGECLRVLRAGLLPQQGLEGWETQAHFALARCEGSPRDLQIFREDLESEDSIRRDAALRCLCLGTVQDEQLDEVLRRLGGVRGWRELACSALALRAKCDGEANLATILLAMSSGELAVPVLQRIADVVAESSDLRTVERLMSVASSAAPELRDVLVQALGGSPSGALTAAAEQLLASNNDTTIDVVLDCLSRGTPDPSSRLVTTLIHIITHRGPSVRALEVLRRVAAVNGECVVHVLDGLIRLTQSSVDEMAVGAIRVIGTAARTSSVCLEALRESLHSSRELLVSAGIETSVEGGVLASEVCAMLPGLFHANSGWKKSRCACWAALLGCADESMARTIASRLAIARPEDVDWSILWRAVQRMERWGGILGSQLAQSRFEENSAMWIEWLIARMGWTSYETESRAMAMGYLRATAESGNGIWRLRLRVAVALRATMRRRASEWDEVLFLWARERDQSTARELRAMLGV